MRYRPKTKTSPQLGDSRVIYKFLWFPKFLPLSSGSDSEWRWLEKTGIEQVYRETYSCAPEMKSMKFKDWCDYKWSQYEG